jgi:hypothetical protein
VAALGSPEALAVVRGEVVGEVDR